MAGHYRDMMVHANWFKHPPLFRGETYHKIGRCSLYKSMNPWELARLAEFNGAAIRLRPTAYEEYAQSRIQSASLTIARDFPD